jgi:hypothetical protein
MLQPAGIGSTYTLQAPSYRYHRDPLGYVQRHAPVADLALPCFASLLELDDVATLGSETSGFGLGAKLAY